MWRDVACVDTQLTPLVIEHVTSTSNNVISDPRLLAAELRSFDAEGCIHVPMYRAYDGIHVACLGDPSALGVSDDESVSFLTSETPTPQRSRRAPRLFPSSSCARNTNVVVSSCVLSSILDVKHVYLHI